MAASYYETILRDLDAATEPGIKKYLKKYAKERAGKKNVTGSVVDDWNTIKQDHINAMKTLLDRTEKLMQIKGVLGFCNYVAPTEGDEDDE